MDRQLVELAPNVRGELRRGTVAPRPILRHGLRGDVAEAAAVGPIERFQGHGVGRVDQQQALADRQMVDFVRQPAGEHLVEDDAEGVDVRTPVQVARVVDLLRAHVGEAAQELSRGGLRRRRIGVLSDVRSHGAGDAEVQDLGSAVGPDHDVGGFQVPVKDPLLVRVLDDVADSGKKPQPVGEREAGAADVGVQMPPRNELHDQERQLAAPAPRVRELLQTGLEDADDAGMTKPAEQSHLGLEPACPTWGDRSRAEKLQGHRTFGVLLPHLVDHRHAAVAKDPHDAVTADHLRQAVLTGRGGGPERGGRA